MNTETAPSTEIEEHRFPCPVCGADLEYSAKTGALDCPHCGHHEDILSPTQNWQLTELDLKSAFEASLEEKQYDVVPYVHCDSCGANVDFGPYEQSKNCPFCGSSIVLEAKTQKLLRPQGVLPFVIDQPTAHELLGKWLGARWFAPNGLADFARKGKRLQGIYVPYWTYDAQTQTEYRGQRGDIYYVTVGHGKNRRREARVRWRRASGRVARFFDDVLVVASNSLPHNYVRELEPWQLSSVEPYNPQFLAGFSSEAYSVTLKDGWQEAQEMMRQVIIRDIKFDIGGDRQRIQQMQTQMRDMSFKHILLPIYSIAYKFRGKTYRCVINGQTGRVTGERPYSAFKIAFAILALAVLVMIFFFFAQYANY